MERGVFHGFSLRDIKAIFQRIGRQRSWQRIHTKEGDNEWILILARENINNESINEVGGNQQSLIGHSHVCQAARSNQATVSRRHNIYSE